MEHLDGYDNTCYVNSVKQVLITLDYRPELMDYRPELMDYRQELMENTLGTMESVLKMMDFVAEA